MNAAHEAAHQGERQVRRNRKTGTVIVVLDADSPESILDRDDGNRWWTICTEHDEVCSHQTLADAQGWAADPTMWCTGCQEVAR